MKKYKGAIFDLDGTLLDSMLVWRQIDVEFLGKRGFEVPVDYLEAITPLGVSQAATYTINRFSLKEKPEDIIAEWLDMAREEYSHHIDLKPFVGEYLSLLSNMNIPIIAATSSDKALILPALERNDIKRYFTDVITVKDVKRGKGFPDIYEKAAKEIACKPEECVVYEDIIEGIRGANMGGFYTVGVYDSESDFSRAAIKKESRCYIDSFDELLTAHDKGFYF